MKKFYLFLTLTVCLFYIDSFSQEQPFVKGVSPTPILKGVQFSCHFSEPGNNTWSTSIPNIGGPPYGGVPGVYVEDTLELVQDNSHSGLNQAYSDPHFLANEGCLDANGQPYVQSSLNGKIAVLFRGSCQFGLKALLAQNNGAEAVILINHTSGDIAPAMSGGDSGQVVNIPIVSLSYDDGSFLLKQMEQGPVVVRIGNEYDSFNSYEIAISKHRHQSPSFRTMPLDFFDQMHNSDEFNKLQITNKGSSNQNPLFKTTLYNNTRTLGSSHSIQVNTSDYTHEESSYIFDSIFLPPWDSTNYITGNYILSTEVDDGLDVDTTNNRVDFPIFFNPSVVSLARTNLLTGEIESNFYPSLHDSVYRTCMLKDWNLNFQSFSTDVEGVFFSFTKDNGNVSGEQIEIEILDDNLNQIYSETYICPADSLNKEIIYHPFLTSISDVHLVCLKTENPLVKFGYDSVPNYLSDYIYDLNNQSFIFSSERRFNPIEIDGVWDDFYGWGAVKALSLGIKYDIPNVSNISEIVNNKLIVFPNPTKEKINISIDNFNGNIQTEVFDLIGNRLKETNETTISLKDYSKGIYILKVAYGNRVEEVKVSKD